MRFESLVVTTAAMCNIEVRAKMAVVLQHLPRFLVSLPTVHMFKVVVDQLRRMMQHGRRAF